MSRIDRLTKQQVELMAKVRDEWLSIGLCTEPADRERAQNAVNQAYEAAKLPPPKIIIWLGSPLAGAIGATMLSARAQVMAQVGDQVWAQVRAQVWAQVGDQVWAQVRDQVGDQVGAQVWAQVGAQVRAQVGDQVRAQVGDQVWAQVGDQVWAACYGQHDANWLAFYHFFEHCGTDAVDRLHGLMESARSAGWWWPFGGAVILTERPCVLKRDERNRLHCADGPALAYPDGSSIFCWHGVRVPEEVMLRPQTLKPEQIIAESNAEIRRVMVERFGAERFLRESNARLVCQDDWGKLWRQELPRDEPVVMVEVVNSTPEPDGSFKNYMLRVPPTVKTPREAVAWTFELGPNDYVPVVQT